MRCPPRRNASSPRRGDAGGLTVEGCPLPGRTLGATGSRYDRLLMTIRRRTAVAVAAAVSLAACADAEPPSMTKADEMIEVSEVVNEAVASAVSSGRVLLCDPSRTDDARVRVLPIADWWLEDGPTGQRAIRPEILDRAIKALDRQCALTAP